MASFRKLILFSVACGTMACGADSSLLKLVMPDAQILVGANVERILGSPIGKDLCSQAHAKLPELPQAMQKAGFDPTRDLKEVLIAATGKGQNGSALVLVRGSFDPDKIRAAVLGMGGKVQSYEGLTIVDNPSQSNGAFAFLDGTTAVSGALDQVQAAIRRRSQPTRLDGHMASQVAEMSDRYDIWVVSAASLSKMTEAISNPQMKQAGDLVKVIEQISGGVKFSANLDLGVELTTHSDKDAERLRDALQLLVGMAAAGQKDASALDLNALKLTADANTVRIAFTVTGEQLKKTYELEMARLQQPVKPAKPVVQNTGITIQSSDSDMGTVVLSSTK